MNEGLTADLYRGADLYRNIPRKEKTRKRYLLPIALMLIGTGVVTSLAYQVGEPAGEEIPTGMLKVTKMDYIQNTLTEYSRRSMAARSDRINLNVSNMYIKTLDNIIIMDTLYAFDENLSAMEIINATFSIEVLTYSLYTPSPNHPFDNDSYNISIPFSVYEILGEWTSWTYGGQQFGVDWNDIYLGYPPVNHTPTATIYSENFKFVKRDWWDAESAYLKGVISFDVTQSIKNWKAGLWYPRWGFLVSTVAPWESNQTWFYPQDIIIPPSEPPMENFPNVTKISTLGGSPPYRGLVMNMFVGNALISINSGIIIPEFSDYFIPVIAIVAIVVLRRRKK